MSAGQIIVGRRSLTVTVYEPVAAKPDLSVAVHETVDVPRGKLYEPVKGMEVPLERAHETEPKTHSSVADTLSSTAVSEAHVHEVVMGAGRLRTGGVLS
jgi:hypothetical protein